ncbi:MAG: FAD-binding protein [Thermoleophilia bacterium]|nr:FAD-binding protein [Thermoleophilia bacterium]
MPTLTVAGAGMGGLVAAARARELGVRPLVVEKGDRPGGSMLLSSCVIWRYRSFDEFRRQCPGGEPALQRLLHERLDGALDWLEGLGAPALERETGNRLTAGRRFDPRALTQALVRAAGPLRLGTPLGPGAVPPLVLATGGFPVALARRRGLLVRSNPWSDGDGLRFARRRGAAVAGALDEFYGRALPAPPARVAELDYVRLAQLYGRFALVLDEAGDEFGPDPVSWSEIDLVQAIADRPGGRAWYVVDEDTLGVGVRGRTVGAMVDAARAAGGTVLLAHELPFELPGAYRYAVHVQAGVTHTLGGLQVDKRARVLRADGTPIAGLYAAGVDAGGFAAGGYASGLAQALVLGLAAAETAAEELSSP